jgi:hypothetical protein
VSVLPNVLLNIFILTRRKQPVCNASACTPLEVKRKACYNNMCGSRNGVRPSF